MPSEYANDIATIKANTGHIIKGLDALTATVEDERGKREELGNRVTRLEERTKTDKWIDRVAIVAGSISAALFGRST